MSTEEERKNNCKKDIDRVDHWVVTAAENGLFERLKRDNKPDTSDKINNKLEEARKNLEVATLSLSSCETNIARAVCALYSSPWSWRFVNIYAGHLWIYLTLFLLSSIFALYYYRIDNLLLGSLGIPNIDPAYEIYFNGIMAVTWGAIGGTVRGIWFLKENVDDRGFRNSWTGWFLSCPFIGGFFGAVVYFIVIAGLVSITLEGVDFNNTLAIIAISVVSGFSWPAALEMIKRVVNSIAGSEKNV